jgi:exonuclease VII large subunit
MNQYEAKMRKALRRNLTPEGVNQCILWVMEILNEALAEKDKKNLDLYNENFGKGVAIVDMEIRIEELKARIKELEEVLAMKDKEVQNTKDSRNKLMNFDSKLIVDLKNKIKELEAETVYLRNFHQLEAEKTDKTISDLWTRIKELEEQSEQAFNKYMSDKYKKAKERIKELEAINDSLRKEIAVCNEQNPHYAFINMKPKEGRDEM